MPKKENMVEIKELDFTYAGAERPALKGVDMQILEGDFLGIIGPSGAGKTTLAYCMNGVIPHYHPGDFYGAVLLNGSDTFKTSLTDLARIAATVFQDIDAQMVASVVEDEILFGLENFGIPHSEIPGRVDEALEMVGICDLKKRYIETLSGGQKQKVALAAVLALKPKLLLLDEPTGELDPRSSHRVFTLLKQLNEEQGITVVVIEQKVGLLAQFTTHLAVLNEGSLRFFGETREVLAHAGALETLGVGVPWVATLPKILREEGFSSDCECCLSVVEAASLIREVLER